MKIIYIKRKNYNYYKITLLFKFKKGFQNLQN